MKSIKLNVYVSNVIVFVALLILWLVVDYIDVKVAKISDLQHDTMITLGVAWVTFSWTNWRLFKLERSVKVLVIPSLSLALTGIWFIISAIVVVEFHLLIGGSL
jgi:hypothetical protein